jgi:hypothetical protein
MVAGATSGSKSSRFLSATVGSIVPVALAAIAMAGGCGTSNATSGGLPEAGPTGPTIGMLEQVTTGGGGAATSSGGGSLFGNLPQDAAEETAPSPPPLDAAPTSDSGDAGPPLQICVDYQPPTCGLGETCDLRYNTCCVNPTSLGTRCVPKSTGCMQEEAPVACVQACECPTGQVCCGYYYKTFQQIGSGCQTVGPGGACQPSPETNTQASAQLCGTDAECTQSTCINQTCIDNVTLNVCGVQDYDPFYCEANDAGI